MSLNRTTFRFCGSETVPFTFYGGFAINFPTGAAALDCSLSTVRSADGIGTVLQQATAPERNITIDGYIVGVPSAVYRRALERAFAPLAAGRLWAETEEHARFYLDCISTAAPAIGGARTSPRFQVQLAALFPYWLSEAEREIRLDTASGAAEVDADIISDVPIPYRAEIFAPTGCQGAVIEAGGQELRYTGTIPAGGTLRLAADAAGRITAALDGADVIGQVSGALRKLPPGRQRLCLALPAESAGTAKLFYREGRSGV